MPSPRAPLYVFFAAFLTFLIAFAGLLVVVKPEIDKRRAQRSAAEGNRDAAAPAPAATTPAETSPAAAPPKAGAQGSSVTVELSGRVVDPKGAPVAGAQVHILVSSKKKEDGSAWPLLTKVAGKDGRFSFRAAIPPSGAFLQATASGYVRSDTRSLPATEQKVAIGNLALKNGGSLRVRVTGDEVGKLAGAEVSITERSSRDDGIASSDVSARTSADGVALLRGIDRGAYRIRARAEGHADAESEWRFDGSGRNGVEELAFVLLPLNSFLSGSVVDQNGVPVAEGEVAVRLAMGDPPARQEWRGKLDGRGQFRVGPVPKGSFEVELVAKGMVQKSQVVGDANGDPVEIVAEHGGAVVGRIATIDDEPFRNPRITVWKTDGKGRAQPVDGAYHVEILKNSPRKFRVDGLGPGRYAARVVAPGFAPGRSPTFNVAAGGACEEVTVELGDGGRAHGTIVDARGAPIANARVTVYEGTAPPPAALAELYPADARPTVQSAGDGTFLLERLSPGPVVLAVESTGQAPRTIGPLLIGEGEEIRLGALTIGGGTILSATVADAKNRPLPFGRALLVAQDGSVRAPFLGDEDGNFVLRGLGEGDYVLSGVDGTAGRTELTLRANETGRVQFTVERR